MKPRLSVATMKRAVAARFPHEAKAADAQLLDYDDDAYETWIETFCDTTNEAMAKRDAQVVDAHLSFMSDQLANGDDEVRRAVDVCYTENLMWSVDVEAKRWAWPRVPANLKQQYVDEWGEPDL